MSSFISLFDLFKIGVGPSSSHTVGPLRAAADFRDSLTRADQLAATRRIVVRLVGSLAHTGVGHHTDRAVIWGLSGLEPETFDRAFAERALELAFVEQVVDLGAGPLPFDMSTDLIFDRDRPVGLHPNELVLEAYDGSGALLHRETYFSVGGGFIATIEDLTANPIASIGATVPHPFSSSRELLRRCREHQLSVADVVRANELTVRTAEELSAGVDRIWSVMDDCIERGLAAEGVLPGGLDVRRRASALGRRLEAGGPPHKGRPTPGITDWVHCWAMAVNEENADGGRVVTAPTNGAAGIIPSVLRYYHRFIRDDDDVRGANETFFLTATAVGILFKTNASISGAEVGCQGEVGVASSMAAAGLAAIFGGTSAQVEHAAEIAIEHHLGLTCDPVGGLVQVPCIERNGFGASTAISAARLAMHESGDHRVTLDQAIATMRQTGLDMHTHYKETSLGGLAVSYVEC